MQLGIRDLLTVLDDNSRSILFPIGNYMAIKNYYTSNIEFINLPSNLKSFTCIRVNPSRKLLAIAYVSTLDNIPSIFIYNLNNLHK
jgi:hypothetical protein